MQRLRRFADQQPVIRSADLEYLAVPRNYLGRLVREGKLERVGRGLYSSANHSPTENRMLLEVCRKVPQAVVCLSSALRFHELTTENSFEVWIALKPGAWSPRIEYPPIRVIRVSGEALTFAVVEYLVEGSEIKVYGPAKTVADCFKFRSKGCLSNRTPLAMVFKLLACAQKSWCRLDGHNQLPRLVLGITFS